jgi:hypothetical protein
LVVNPATGALAQRSVIAQQARDAKKLKTRMAEEERAEAVLASDVDVQQASLCVVINQPVGNPKRKV